MRPRIQATQDYHQRITQRPRLDQPLKLSFRHFPPKKPAFPELVLVQDVLVIAIYGQIYLMNPIRCHPNKAISGRTRLKHAVAHERFDEMKSQGPCILVLIGNE